MEEPLLLRSRKRPNALFSSALFQIPEGAPVKDPEYAPMVSPSPSSVLKERLIFGSPDMSPGSHFNWLDYALPSDQYSNEAEKEKRDLVTSRPSSLHSSGLFPILEESPVNKPEPVPIVSPFSSSIKERLLFGSPDASPESHVSWIDYALPSDESNNEAERRGLLEDSEDVCSCGNDNSKTNEPSRGSDTRLFDDSFMDNRVMGFNYPKMSCNSDLTMLDLAASPRFRPMPLKSPGSRKFAESREESENMPFGKDMGKQSHSVSISPEPSIGKKDAECRTCTKRQYHRSRTAPAVTVMEDRARPQVSHKSTPSPSTAVSLSVVTQACFGLVLYLIVGVAIFTVMVEHFSGTSTESFVDALYFCIVTLCTIGYGDITPTSPFAKLFSCAFVLVGFGFIDILLSGMVNYVLDSQEALLLNAVAAGHHETSKKYLVDIKKGRMRIRLKVALAFGVVITCLGVGTFVLHFLEKLGWLDSFYLACMSVTTVGYGDHAFTTLPGRLFASIWLLVSTLAVARSFLYLAEARIDKRHRLIAKLVLEKEMTLGDLVAADSDNDGCVSKSDFVVYKLKLMGKIADKDIADVCRQFNRLDTENSGKIHLSYLLDLHHR